MQSKFTTIEDYINSFPKEVQARLLKLQEIIKECAPDAQESFSYGMPAFKLHGPLVYFAGYKNHIGFYPVPSGAEAFKKELTPYQTGKGTVQFPHSEPIPYDLVRKIVMFRVDENLKKYTSKNKEY